MIAVALEDVFLLVVAAIVTFGLLIASFVYSWIGGTQPASPSPYTGKPLRRAIDIPWDTKAKVLKYMFERTDYANQIISFEHAALCRETGRIFPKCVTWYGAIRVDWRFLNKRYPGDYISWGSLNKEHQKEIRQMHHSMDGYQTHYSSQNSSPNRIEEEYALMKPGPLYVDPATGVLLGWKCVPDTDIEVLIVQRPVEQYLPGIHKKY